MLQLDLGSGTQFEIQSEELKSLIRGKNTGLDTHYTYIAEGLYLPFCSFIPSQQTICADMALAKGEQETSSFNHYI